MKRTILSTLLMLSLLPFLPQQVLAQQLCAQARDENDCQEKVDAPLVQKGILATELDAAEAQAAIEKLKAGANEEVQELVADGVAGELLEKVSPEIAVLPGASAAFEDFLNRLRIGLTSEGTDDEQALAFDFTDFFGFPPRTATSSRRWRAIRCCTRLFRRRSRRRTATSGPKGSAPSMTCW